jgi:hypothetical protein
MKFFNATFILLGFIAVSLLSVMGCGDGQTLTGPLEWRQVRTESDENNDGIAERIAYYLYDEQGNMTDYDDAGVEFDKHFSYDPMGRVVQITDGRNNRCELRYNPNGRNDYMGGVSRGALYGYEKTYDDNGHLIDQQATHMNQGTAYLYNSTGRLIQKSFYKRENGEKIFTKHIYYSYNESGEMEWMETDGDNDGILDRAVHYIHDETGQLKWMETDDNHDGIVEEAIRYYHDPDGQKIREERDWDNDGTIDNILRYFYDENQNRIKRENDLYADGSRVLVNTFFWELGVLNPVPDIAGACCDGYERLPQKAH